MAQVPYNGAPQVSPSGQAIGSVNENAPADAFGAAQAAGLGELGGAVSKSGDVLFARALALQDLANQSAAREADAEYIIKAGELQAQFNSLEGPQAIAAYPKYQKDLDDLRVMTGERLNPMARKLYDSSARNTMARTIFNGAGHAATQNRKWAKETLVAEMDLAAKTVENNTDPQTFDQQLTRVRQAAINLAGLNGEDPDSPQAQVRALTAQSALWRSRIIGISRTDPEAADRMLEANKTRMTQQDVLFVDNSVRQQSRAIGSQNLAESVYDPTKTVDQLIDDARKKAKELHPNDPIFERNTVAAVRGYWNQQQYASRQQVLADRQVVAGAISEGVKTVQEMRANPTIAAAIDRLPKTEQNDLQARINRFNQARDKNTNQEEYNRIYAMSNNDVEQFLNLDMTQQKLSQADMRKLQALQEKRKEQPAQDPRVARAVGWLRTGLGSQLEALGIFKRTKDNVNQYDTFQGALQVALDVWQEENKKPATYKDVVETIGPQLIQQRMEPGAIFGNLWKNQRAFFDQDVPQAFADKLKADVVAKGGQEPNQLQIQRAWMRTQFNNLYGKKAPVKDDSRIP